MYVAQTFHFENFTLNVKLKNIKISWMLRQNIHLKNVFVFWHWNHFSWWKRMFYPILCYLVTIHKSDSIDIGSPPPKVGFCTREVSHKGFEILPGGVKFWPPNAIPLCQILFWGGEILTSLAIPLCQILFWGGKILTSLAIPLCQILFWGGDPYK